MRLIPTALLTMGVTACRGDLVGEWSGSCEIYSQSGVWDVDIDLDIDTQRSGRATGTGSLVFGRQDLQDYSFDGPVAAEITDDDVEFRLEGVAGGYLIILDGEGRIRDDDIDGDCVLDYVGESVGDLELNR